MFSDVVKNDLRVWAVTVIFRDIGTPFHLSIPQFSLRTTKIEEIDVKS